MTVSQTRKGRRPMRVDTMLKKEKDGSLYKKAEERFDWHGQMLTTDEIAQDCVARICRAAGTEEAAKIAAEFGTNSAGYDLQGKTKFQGLPVAIENRKGSVREGENDDGSKWKTKYRLPYGYLEGTKGADGEEVDAYVGPNKAATKAFVVQQKKDDGSYDEDTVMLGFKSKADAKKAILQHYDDPKYVGKVMPMSMDKLKELVASKKKLTKIAQGRRQFITAMLKDASTSVPASQVGGGSSELRPGPQVGKPARGKRKPGDVPSLDEPSTYPKTEQVQTNQGTTALVTALDAGSYR